MDIKLYNRNLSIPSLIETLTPGEGLRFTTKMPGGFGVCEFSVARDYARAYTFLTRNLINRIVITDNLMPMGSEKVLYEGRIEDIELSAEGLHVTAYGYYSSLTDQIWRLPFDTHADDIIKVVLANCCPQISSDYSNIDALDITVTSAADESYLDITPQAVFEKVLDFSDTTHGKWDFAIWEGRKAYLKKRVPSEIDWKVSLRDFNTFKLKQRASSIYNRVYGIYRDTGGVLVRTDAVEDAASIAFYDNWIREKAVPDMGE